jgi:hypothetical protein
MAIKLASKPNVDAPGGDYPYGNIKDDTGSNDGTPLNKLVHADFHQYFAKLLADAQITGNDLPESTSNTFQYILALKKLINTEKTLKVDTTSTSNAGTGETTVFSYTVAASKLATDGDSIKIALHGKVFLNKNPTIRVKIDGNTYAQISLLNTSSNPFSVWNLSMTLCRRPGGFALVFYEANGGGFSTGIAFSTIDFSVVAAFNFAISHAITVTIAGAAGATEGSGEMFQVIYDGVN